MTVAAAALAEARGRFGQDHLGEPVLLPIVDLAPAAH
jgi:hypothetical protein